jgi:succinate-semialdehyde dehydrogenase/glutarate-semialdehyde dehydrogenase
MRFTSTDPSSGEVIAEYPSLTDAEVAEVLTRADMAFRSWRRVDSSSRARVLTATAGVLRDRLEDLARLMTQEMGKPLDQARAEVEKCAWVCEYYAAEGTDHLAPVAVETDAFRSMVAFEPLGVILAIMPWNFPLWQVVRFAAPTLMAGNAALLKHAPTTQGCAHAIEDVFLEARLPGGVFQNLPVDVDAIPGIIADPRVAAVTLTGSTRAGKAVAATAGAHIKKTVLELGGSDPYLILEDADLDAAAAQCTTGRLINSGQSCIAAKRFIVVASVMDDFRERVLARMGAAVMGDPLNPATHVGPMARKDLRDTLRDQVARSVRAGALCLLGGQVPERPGWFYPPTVLSDVRPGMAAFDEELFGPVATLIEARDEVDAIELANRTRYGLSAAVFTRDLERGERIARERIEAGACFVNAFGRSDPRLPFGGIKESGYGRELSEFGIREFVNIKTVWVA